MKIKLLDFYITLGVKITPQCFVTIEIDGVRKNDSASGENPEQAIMSAINRVLDQKGTLENCVIVPQQQSGQKTLNCIVKVNWGDKTQIASARNHEYYHGIAAAIIESFNQTQS